MTNYRSCIEINLANLSENIIILKKHLNSDTKFMAVIKANAYGHGIEEYVNHCDALVDYYGVATLEEAKCIRDANSKKDILIFGSIHPSQLPEVIKNHFTINLHSKCYADALCKELHKLNQLVKSHIEVDTGLNRTGIRFSFSDQTNLPYIESLYQEKHFNITGIYTHFACAESLNNKDVRFTKQQYKSFKFLINNLKSKGINIGIAHCSNSGAFINYPEFQLNMVRLGMLIYGQYTDDYIRKTLGLKPAIQWKAAIVDVKHLEIGESVSYNRTFIAERPTDIAIISTGYADGYKRSNSNHSYVLINDFPVPLIGLICMDFMIADITDLPNKKNLSYALLLGEESQSYIPVNNLAFGTVNGDITSSISNRVQRIYLGDVHEHAD
ncbi:alanine racemase [Enterocloster bolteae]|mgnify:CR=1 FL=1|uniref:alanine racemase n=1 Tax=Enterocloster bolteae TaxID=208479 RepID=UPI00189C6618|nr:alanine racemase [Enterocloster bolteae]